MRLHALCLSASVLALGWSGLAAAQTTPSGAGPSTRGENGAANPTPEVVVTAERRSTNLQQTAIAATVLTGAELIRKGVFTVDQLQFVSPSLTVNNFGQGNDVDIRGIGKGEHNSQTTTGVVTYRDGVATFPGYFQEEPYFDIAGVEVLRGPQGTFSGQNATGGAVIVNTQDPKINGGYGGYLLGHYGNYNDTGLQGAVNLPVSDTLAARVAFNGEYRDSFYKISGLTRDPNLYWGSVRLSLLWTPTPNLKVLFKTDYDYLDSGGYFGDAILNPATGTVRPTDSLFKFANNYENVATDQFVRSVLRVDYKLDDGVTLRSVSGYQQGRSAYKGDISGGANLPGPDYSIAEAVNERVYSQEFNIISPDKGPITWILGAYYQNNTYYFPPGRFDIGVPPGVLDEALEGANLTHTGAVFGQVSFNLPAGFQLQVGLRYSDWSTVDHVRFYVPEYAAFNLFSYSADNRETGVNTTGKVTLNWNLDANNFLYAFVASGAKPGGLNNPIVFAGGLIPPPFGQEYVTDYEIGWKSKLFDNHLRTQIGAYYNDFDHFQVIVPIPNNPVQATELNNPSTTVLYGFEASAQYAYHDFSVYGGLGLEHSSLGKVYAEDPRTPVAGTSCSLTSGPVGPGCINLQGHPQTYAPNFTFNIGAQYNVHLTNGDLLTPSVSYSHISDQWATLFDNVAQGDHLAARDILGASLAWTHGGVVTTLYGSNLTNDQYISAIAAPIRYAGAPRQFGISVMKVF